MSLTRPILSNVIPFDATQDYSFLFTSIGGDQVTASNLVIQRVTDSVVVYDAEITTFSFSHLLPLNSLVNNTQYKAKIRTKNASLIYSDFSDWILFYCYTPAIIDITNLNGGIANNQVFSFIGSYTQENDPIQNFTFTLYNSNMTQLGTSSRVYSSTIAYTFTLMNNTNYYIKLICTSQSGVVTEKTVGFLASYIAPTIGAELTLTNQSSDGSVKIEVIASQIDGVGAGYVFESSDWINLKGVSAYVSFIEGLDGILKNYILKLYFKNITENIVFLTITTVNGDIKLKYYENRFHVFKTSRDTGILGHFISSSDITFLSTDNVCVELKMIDNLIDVYASIYT